MHDVLCRLLHQNDLVKDSITQQALKDAFAPARHGLPMGGSSPADPQSMRVNECLNCPTTAGYNLASFVACFPQPSESACLRAPPDIVCH